MTLLERLITQQVSASVVTTLTRTTDRIAEQMAEEILRDPEFRVEMQGLIRVAFAQALRRLQQDQPPSDTP